jgi:hypothetical protein
MPHSTRTVQKTGFQKKGKKRQKIKPKNPTIHKKENDKKLKKGQKTKKSIKTKSHFFEWDRKNRIQKMAISKRDKRPGKKRQKTWV